MSDTCEKLLRAAETLFAQKGINATRLRDVNLLAGQRNTSAIRYHFGGMKGLLEHLVDLRMGELDGARQHALDELEASRPAADISIEDYVGVLVLPLSARVHADKAWASWVRVLAQLISVRGHEHRRLWENRHDRATRAVFQRIRKRLPETPAPIWRQRIEDMMLLCIGSLCERADPQEQAGRRARLNRNAYESNLVRVASAVLSA